MSRFDNEIRVRPSVLDRLIDYEPEYSREAPASRVKNLRILKQSVRRDLEWLLNTRSTAVVPPELKEVQSSVAVYGLPDMTTLSAKSPGRQGEAAAVRGAGPRGVRAAAGGRRRDGRPRAGARPLPEVPHRRAG